MYYYRRYYLDAVWTRQATSLQMTALQKAPLGGGWGGHRGSTGFGEAALGLE
ncbi:MAG: hypothetical protein IKR25_05220 [Muribaculaceae bacterium]|nr:hypothetical protein [Muribaculaceae bacterium]